MTPELSVIVCYRNEEARIAALLQSILLQNFKAFELILVDDFSDDETSAIATDILHSSAIAWRMLDLKQYLGPEAQFTANKKKGIELAVELSASNIILLTDADGEMDANWITTMLHFFQKDQYALCFGPVRFKPSFTLLTLFQEIDLIAMMECTARTIRHKLPMLGNAANMIFSKPDFSALEGYSGNKNISSGDDIFLLQKCLQTKRKVGFIKEENAVVTTRVEETFNGFIQQRIRWAGKSTTYSNSAVKFALLGIYLLNLLIVVLFVLTITHSISAYLLLCFLGLKMIMDALIIFPGLVFFKRKKLILGMPLFECLHILYVVCIGFLSLRTSYIWKGRRIKK